MDVSKQSASCRWMENDQIIQALAVWYFFQSVQLEWCYNVSTVIQPTWNCDREQIH